MLDGAGRKGVRLSEHHRPVAGSAKAALGPARIANARLTRTKRGNFGEDRGAMAMPTTCARLHKLGMSVA
jgi:hypothetical protein